MKQLVELRYSCGSIELENTAPPLTRAVLLMKLNFRLVVLQNDINFAKVMIAIAPPLLPVLPSNVVEELMNCGTG